MLKRFNLCQLLRAKESLVFVVQVTGNFFKTKVLTDAEDVEPFDLSIKSNGEWQLNSNTENSRTSSTGFSAKRNGFKQGEFSIICITVDEELISFSLNSKVIGTTDYNCKTPLLCVEVHSDCRIYCLFKCSGQSALEIGEITVEKIKQQDIKYVQLEDLELYQGMIDKDRRLINLISLSKNYKIDFSIDNPEDLNIKETISQRMDDVMYDGPDYFTKKTKNRLSIAMECAELLSNCLPQESFNMDFSMDSTMVSQLESSSIPDELIEKEEEHDNTINDSSIISSSPDHMEFLNEDFTNEYKSEAELQSSSPNENILTPVNQKKKWANKNIFRSWIGKLEK